MDYRSPQEVLDDMIALHTLTQHNMTRLGEMIAQYRDLIPVSGDRPIPHHRRVGIKSLDAWVSWLGANQPAYRSDIVAEVGPLATGATPYVRKWQPHMEAWPDDQLDDHTLMSISGPKIPKAKGRPQVIYFLWSQRNELWPLFNVGPEPEPGTSPEPQQTKQPASASPPPISDSDDDVEPLIPGQRRCAYCMTGVTPDENDVLRTVYGQWSCEASPDNMHRTSIQEPDDITEADATQTLTGVIAPPENWQDDAWQASNDIGPIQYDLDSPDEVGETTHD